MTEIKIKKKREKISSSPGEALITPPGGFRDGLACDQRGSWPVGFRFQLIGDLKGHRQESWIPADLS